jgi:hypothetical protein
MGDGFDCSIRFSQLAMETGTEDVWSTIATALVRHPDNDLVSGFLLERVESSRHNLTNYYQSLELLGDSWATSILRRKYASYRSRSHEGSSESNELDDSEEAGRVVFPANDNATAVLRPSKRAPDFPPAQRKKKELM